MSPTLFTIAFNDLIKRLKTEGVEVAAYADDLVVIGELRGSLEKAIEIVE